MECPIRTPVCTDEDKQDQDRVRLSELCRTRDELFADVSGPMVPRSFSESISSFVTYSPLDIDGTNTGPLFFLPRAELDQDLRSALAPTWRHLDEGNAEFVYSVDMSEWFAVSWDSVVRADYDGADCPESEDWDLCFDRGGVLETYGLILPVYAHRPNGNTKFEYMSDYAFLPKQDNVPHMACVICDTHCTIPSQSQITLGEMHAVFSLLSFQFACEKFSDHSIKPVLVFAFQHDQYARITQAHFDCERERVVIRQSRALDLRDVNAPEDAFILLRWMLNTPLGDTRYKEMKEEHKSPRTQPPPPTDRPLPNKIEVR